MQARKERLAARWEQSLITLAARADFMLYLTAGSRRELPSLRTALAKPKLIIAKESR
jgi:hypothetical protein